MKPSDKPKVVQLGDQQRRLKSLDEFERPWPPYQARRPSRIRTLPLIIFGVAVGVALGLLLF